MFNGGEGVVSKGLAMKKLFFKKFKKNKIKKFKIKLKNDTYNIQWYKLKICKKFRKF